MERLFLECAIRAALIVAGTAIVLYAMRVKTAAVKHRVWTAMVLLMLALPVLTAWGPQVPLRVLPSSERTATSNQAIVSADIFPIAAVRPGAAVTHLKTSEPATRLPVWGWYAISLSVYLVGLLSLLARLAIGTLQAHMLVRHAVLRDGRLTSISCAAPVTVGWLHPTVILPDEWRQWSQAQLDAVLTHEGAHARRRDPLVQWLALLNRAVFWFHPAAWWLERELSALAEEACDSAVLARGHNPKDYSEYLLDMARSIMRSGARVNVVGMAMPGARLPQRIRRIIEGGPAPRISRTRMACLAAACAITCSLFADGTLDHVRQGRSAQATMIHRSLLEDASYAELQESGPREEQSGSPKSAALLPKRPTMLLAQTSTNAQSPARNAPTTQEAASDGPILDSVSVRRNTIDAHLSGHLFAPGGMSGTHFSAYNASLQDLLQVAYQMTIIQEMPEEPPKNNFQWTGNSDSGTGSDTHLQVVSGAPAWLSTDRFNIEADVSGNYSPAPAEKLLVLQMLLADRFKLRVHHEMQPRPGYALVLSNPRKTGPQLYRDSQDGIVNLGPIGAGPAEELGRQRIIFKWNMEGLAKYLSGAYQLDSKLDRPVVDRTGLSGTYDFTVEWASPSNPFGPTFLTAMQEQLGLKLVPQTSPVDVFVIDHVERPSGN